MDAGEDMERQKKNGENVGISLCYRQSVMFDGIHISKEQINQRLL
jgi:hypothetical protein